MADRYFPNEMPHYVPEKTSASTSAVDETVTEIKNRDSFTKFLSLPYDTLSRRLKASALDLKDTVNNTTSCSISRSLTTFHHLLCGYFLVLDFRLTHHVISVFFFFFLMF